MPRPEGCTRRSVNFTAVSYTHLDVYKRQNKKKGLNMKVITMESSAYKEMMAQIANIAGYIREARDEKKPVSYTHLGRSSRNILLQNGQKRYQKPDYIVFGIRTAVENG